MRHSDPKRALEVYDHSLVRIREIPNDIVARRIETLLLAGSSYAARRILGEKDARARIDAAFRLMNETKDYPADGIIPGTEADVSLRALADHYPATNHPGQALEVCQGLLRKIMASNPDPENDLPNAVSVSRLNASLATLFRLVRKPDQAAPLDARRLELWQHWNRKLPNNLFVRRQLERARLR